MAFNLRIIFYIAIFTFGCQSDKTTSHMDKSFYYWKTIYKLNHEEQFILDTLHVNSLYVRYFDVDWDDKSKQAIPKAPVYFNEIPKQKVIPVIFLTNRTLVNIQVEDISVLANKIVHKVNSINANRKLAYSEIQLDCDWTETSRFKYFLLLKELKMRIGSSKILSATIRLHQVKFHKRTGIPPVDKGVLMVYNIANLNDVNTVNSIFDPDIILQYTAQLDQYPLHLDLAFPVFNQNVLFRNHIFTGVLRDINYFDPNRVPVNFKKIKNNLYLCIRDTMISNYFIKREDVLRSEKVDYDQVKRISESLRKQLKSDTFTLLIFDLNSNHFINKSIDEINELFLQK